MKPAKAGQLLQVDRGAYSDYSVTGFFVVLKEFYPLAELDKYLEAHPDQKGEEYSFEPDQFLAGLLAQGLLLEIEHATLYLGSYHCTDDVRFTPLRGKPE